MAKARRCFARGSCTTLVLFVLGTITCPLGLATRAAEPWSAAECLRLWVDDGRRFPYYQDCLEPTDERQLTCAETLEAGGQQLRAAYAYITLWENFPESDRAETAAVRTVGIYAGWAQFKTALQVLHELHRRYSYPSEEDLLHRIELAMAAGLLDAAGDAADIPLGVRVGEARAVLERVLTEDKYGPWGEFIEFHLARCDQAARCYTNAVEAYTRFLKSYPNTALAEDVRGRIKDCQTRLAKGPATPVVERALPEPCAEPFNPFLEIGGRRLTLFEALYFERVKNLSLETKKRPQSPDAFLELGKLFFVRGNHDLAKDLFAKAAGLDDGLGSTHYFIGLSDLAAGRNEGALHSLLRAKELGAGEDDIGFLIAQAQELAGNHELALQAYDAFSRSHPGDSQVLLCKARCLLRVGQYAQALTVADAGLALATENKAITAGDSDWDYLCAQYNSALLSLSNKKPEDALRRLTELEAFGPARADALLLKARVLEHLQRNGDAQITLRELRKARPDILEAAEGCARLAPEQSSVPPGTRLRIALTPFPPVPERNGILNIRATTVNAAHLPYNAFLVVEVQFPTSLPCRAELVPVPKGQETAYCGTLRIASKADAGPLSVKAFINGTHVAAEAIGPVTTVVVPEGPQVVEVEFHGLRQTDERDVLHSMATRKGRAYDKRIIAEDIGRLKQRFPAVKISEPIFWPGGVKLVIEIDENVQAKPAPKPSNDKPAPEF